MTEFHVRGQWQPEHIFHDLNDIVSIKQGRSSFDFNHRDIRYCCLLNKTDAAERLFVSLCSVVYRRIIGPPGFERHRWADQLGGHLLAVSDPTLLMSDGIEAGCWLGHKDQNVVSGLVQLAEHVGSTLGCPPEKIVYWGHSAAGFGAGMAAVYSGRSRAVLCNPLLDVPAYRHHVSVKEALRVFGTGSLDAAILEYAERTRIATAIQAARDLGRQPKILVAQNVNDSYYYKRQYLPFCDTFNIDPKGGADATGFLEAMPFEHKAGHGIEPPEVVEKILRHIL